MHPTRNGPPFTRPALAPPAPPGPVSRLWAGNILSPAGDAGGVRPEWLRTLFEAPESPAAAPAQANLQRLDVKQE